MNTFVKTLTVAAVIATLMTGFATVAHADVNQNQNMQVNCTSGAYGQNTTCTATGNQNQNVTNTNNGQTTIIYTGPRHIPVNTSVDPTIFGAGVVTMITTAGGAVLTFIKRK